MRRRATVLGAVVGMMAAFIVTATPAQAHADFVRMFDEPIMTPSLRGYDKLAITSPSVVRLDGVYHMVYAGFRLRTVQLLGATSTDGIRWTKRRDPVLEPDSDRRWMNMGVAEAELRRGSDGVFYLFFTGLGPNDARAIGIARSTGGPFGPWVVNPKPIVQRSGEFPKAIAPSVAVDPFGDGRALLYYSYTDQGEGVWGLRVATAREPFWNPSTSRWAEFSPANDDEPIVTPPQGSSIGDAAIVMEDGVFYLFFTCLTHDEGSLIGLLTVHLATCEATSTSGLEFVNDSPARVFSPRRAPAWDENVETPFVMKDGPGRYLMWYVGYRGNVLNPAAFYGASIGLASSPTL
ncbi:MAG: hypothetical protein ABR518_09825 [Actinomycetota bacterium]